MPAFRAHSHSARLSYKVRPVISPSSYPTYFSLNWQRTSTNPNTLREIALSRRIPDAKSREQWFWLSVLPPSSLPQSLSLRCCESIKSLREEKTSPRPDEFRLSPVRRVFSFGCENNDGAAHIYTIYTHTYTYTCVVKRKKFLPAKSGRVAVRVNFCQRAGKSFDDEIVVPSSCAYNSRTWCHGNSSLHAATERNIYVPR